MGSAPEESGVQGWRCMDWCWEPGWTLRCFGCSRQLIALCLNFPTPVGNTAGKYCFHLRLLKASHPRVCGWQLEKSSLFQSLRKGKRESVRTGLCLGIFLHTFWQSCWDRTPQQLPSRGVSIHRTDASRGARAVRSQMGFHSTSADPTSGVQHSLCCS